jgi:hypothetical protein
MNGATIEARQSQYLAAMQKANFLTSTAVTKPALPGGPGQVQYFFGSTGDSGRATPIDVKPEPPTVLSVQTTGRSRAGPDFLF